MPNAGVLIASHNLHHIETIKEFLAGQNYAIFTAQDGATTQTLLRTEPQIMIAIIDLRMRDPSDTHDYSGLHAAALRPQLPKIITLPYFDFVSAWQKVSVKLPLTNHYLSNRCDLGCLADSVGYVLEIEKRLAATNPVSLPALHSALNQHCTPQLWHTLCQILAEALDLTTLPWNQCDLQTDKIHQMLLFLRQKQQLPQLIRLWWLLRPNFTWHHSLFMTP